MGIGLHPLACRGRTLGGSSAVNFFAWNKPPADHIDGASSLQSHHRIGAHRVRIFVDLERLGNPGWNWANFQKYIARAEGYDASSSPIFFLRRQQRRFVPPTPEEIKEHELIGAENWKLGENGMCTLLHACHPMRR